MNVAGIFKILIIVVACVVVGALVLNVLLPNALDSVVWWVESSIQNATGANFDLNGDGSIGTPAHGLSGEDTDNRPDVGGYSGFQNDTQ